MQPVSVPADQRDTQDALFRLLERLSLERAGSPSACRLVGSGGESIPIPNVIFGIIERMVELFARSGAITIVPVSHEMTTQQAADIINVSPQYSKRLSKTWGPL